MSSLRVRDFHHADIDAVLALWQEFVDEGSETVYSLADVISSCQNDFAVVAVDEGQVIGAAVGRAAHAQGWVVFLKTRRAWQHQGIGGRMLSALERRMIPNGLAKLSALLPESATRLAVFTDQGFVPHSNFRYLERRAPLAGKELNVLSELGGRLFPRGLWDSIGGMQAEKDLIERRLIMPLANSDVAARFGVSPPSAVVLFGPPGTGKTTFARAIASRLEWSFVEVFPSRLAEEPGGLAGALRGVFLRIQELERAVVFIDEVEEIAVQRGGEPPSAMQGVTNELLKIIPAFREQPNRLLVCATNFIRALDSAFLRHGRFDYVIPIGLPDEQARASIWTRYVPAAARETVDVSALVARTNGFSPADIEFAARKASQAALEDALDAPSSTTDVGPGTGDYLRAISDTRATVSKEVADAFLQDIETLARL